MVSPWHYMIRLKINLFFLQGTILLALPPLGNFATHVALVPLEPAGNLNRNVLLT